MPAWNATPSAAGTIGTAGEWIELHADGQLVRAVHRPGPQYPAG